jgi:D-glycero-D-manno-heptose 1,7-bisphosphate phosphatase
MRSELSKHGVYIDGIYYCPHHPDGKGRYRVNCGCRKPNPGMLLRAAEDFGLDLKRCWMIGDKLSDIEAGIRAGCKTILVLTGYGKRILKEKKDWKIEPHLIKKDLYEAVLTILQDSQ